MDINSYADMFMSNPNLAPEPAVGLASMLILSMFRIMPIVALAPFFGGRVMPNPAKVGLGLAIFGIMFPYHTQTITAPLLYNHTLYALVLKEALIGMFMGYFMSLPFTIAESAGIFIDHQRGGASLMVQDPTTQSQASPLGTLYNQSFIYLFYLATGPFIFLNILMDSYDMIPMDQTFSMLFWNHEGPFWQKLLTLYGKVMIISIRMASPALLIILMTDVFLGITNRLAPQVQITFWQHRG